MIGNDLVDLRQAASDSNWQRKGYLSKIYTPAEQQLIVEAAEPAVMVWLIWTMKEAAYKIISRRTGLRSYNPLELVCGNLITDQLQATGRVKYGDEVFEVKSKISTELIHSIAVSKQEDFDGLHLHFLPYTKTYPEDFNRSSVDYTLVKTLSGLPEMIHTATGNRHAASVSHHGRFLAVTYSGSLLLTD